LPALRLMDGTLLDGEVLIVFKKTKQGFNFNRLHQMQVKTCFQRSLAVFLRATASDRDN
jgi:hypothetical protein